MSEPIYILRKKDCALFVPSTINGKATLSSMTSTRDSHGNFYFRQIVWQPRRWWQLRGRWVENGESWIVSDVVGWEVLIGEDLRRFER